MGGGVSKPDSHDLIKVRLQEAAARTHKDTKILLLGSGESGKSTIVKQMRIIDLDATENSRKRPKSVEELYTKKELNNYKRICRNNTVTAIQSLINACYDLDIPFSTANEGPICARIMDLDPEDPNPDIDCRDDIKTMWEDDGVKQAVLREKEFHFLDSGPYFLNAVDRTFSASYKVTQEDILRSRITTTGIVEFQFEASKMSFKMYDVGGQRGERKRWIHSFDDVTGIMFIASMSEYDQVLAEDRSVNRMDESLNLFESIANLPWFSKAAIFLFLNKQDLFAIKIKRVPINKYFPDYDDWEYDPDQQDSHKRPSGKKGPMTPIPWEKGNDEQNYDEGAHFIRDLYNDRLDETRKGTLYTFFTDATCSDTVENVWKSAKHHVLHVKLQSSCLAMF